jgi:hypothetical protein
MLKVQEYLLAHGLEKLVEEFSVQVTDYPDRVVLNYDQIKSPRFHLILDECRALILHKGTWKVMSRAFDRFYNVGEGEVWKQYNVAEAHIQQKLDGSIMSLYHDGQKWCVATRKRAFAEGPTQYGRTFSEIFWGVLDPKLFDFGKDITWIFELCGPENRVVTRYEKPTVYLLGGRNRQDGRELSGTELDNVASATGIQRPQTYQAKTFDEVKALAESLPTLDEGFVLVWESPTGSHYRLKCKNSAYLAVAHMRDNGVISPKHIMRLVLKNEHLEYLSYFDEDRPLFDVVTKEFDQYLTNAKTVYEECRHLTVQKDFALAIQAKLIHKTACGALFTARKTGAEVEPVVREMDPDKLAESLGLKEKLGKLLIGEN